MNKCCKFSQINQQQQVERRIVRQCFCEMNTRGKYLFLCICLSACSLMISIMNTRNYFRKKSNHHDSNLLLWNGWCDHLFAAETWYWNNKWRLKSAFPSNISIIQIERQIWGSENVLCLKGSLNLFRKQALNDDHDDELTINQKVGLLLFVNSNYIDLRSQVLISITVYKHKRWLLCVNMKTWKARQVIYCRQVHERCQVN